jgi:hypothetical protein
VLEAKSLSSGTLDFTLQAQPVFGIVPDGAGGTNLVASLFTNANVFYAATITAIGPSQNLTASLFTNTQTVYGSTITTTGPNQDLTASLFTNTQTFYGPTATNVNTVLPAILGSTNFIYAASIAATNDLTAALFTNSQIFYGPTATNLNTLSPPMFADSDFVFPPTISTTGPDQSVTAPLLSNVSIIFAPTVASAQPQPILGGGSLVRPRKKFRPAILFDFPEPEIVLPDVDAKVTLAGLSATLQLGSVVATSPDPINSRAKIGFTQIEAYTSRMVAGSSWNDPSDEELLFILDYALD